MARDLPARTVLNGPQTVENRRDARGRFVAGAPPGPGRPVANPFARYQCELRAALLREVSPGDVRTILRQVVKIAKRGHLPAVELLLKWVLGAPPVPVDPDRLDEHELSVQRSRPTLIDQLALTDELAEDNRGVPATEEADDQDLPPPPLQAKLSWALREWAEAQTRVALPPPPDPAAGWERFAASRLEWDAQAAVPVDLLFVTYARWCANHGEPVLAEEKVLAWLTTHEATMRTGPLSQVTAVEGVRVVD